MSEDVFYVATRKDSGGHWLFNGPEYLENYENEFERIREFDTLEDAQKALKARESVEAKERDEARRAKARKNIIASKVRGDIRKGSVDDEELRAKIKAELEAEMVGMPAPPEPEITKPTRAKRGAKQE